MAEIFKFDIFKAEIFKVEIFKDEIFKGKIFRGKYLSSFGGIGAWKGFETLGKIFLKHKVFIAYFLEKI